MAQYYAAIYGRGMMQLTWPFNYAGYGEYRGFANATGGYADARITALTKHDWQAPKKNSAGVLVHDLRKWSPRYDPDRVASDMYSACDSGGYYWVSKSCGGQPSLSRFADGGVTTEAVGRMSVLVDPCSS